MALNKPVETGGGMSFTPMETATYPARLVGIIDLSVQPQRPYQGKPKAPAEEIALTYEFVDEFMLDEDGQVDETKPRWLTEFMVHYPRTAERATSAKRMNALDPNNTVGEDWSKLIGTPVNVSVVQDQKGDRVYENIAGISTMRAKDIEKCPELVNEPMLFDFDSPDLETFERLPKFIQKKLREGPKFPGSVLAKLLGDTSEPAKDMEAKATPENEGAEVENPY